MVTTRSKKPKAKPSKTTSKATSKATAKATAPPTNSEAKHSSVSKEPTIEDLLGFVGQIRDQSERVVNLLVERGDASEIFDGLSSANQHILFTALWKDHDRLRKLGETHEVIASGLHRRPSADKELALNYTIRTRDIRYDGDFTGFGKYDEGTVYEDSDDTHQSKEPKIAVKRYVEDKETGKVDVLNADGYMVKGYFRQRWLYDSSKAKDVPLEERPGRKISWGSMSLLKERSGTELVPESMVFQFLRYGYEPVRLFTRISSQLLLYRLTAIFGMPPATEYLDEYKQIWSAKLYWNDDRNSCLGVFDYQGSPSFYFEGYQDASKSALKLIEFILSDNVPHPYDSVLAGNIA